MDPRKAKHVLLTLIGSAANAGSDAGDSALQALVPCLVEFLDSEAWAAWKATGEALTRLDIAERGRLGGFKPSCLAFFEVKIVRDLMNKMMEVWKEIPDIDLDASPPPSQSQLISVKETVSDGIFLAAFINSSPSVQSSYPFIVRKSRQPTSRSPSPAGSPVPTGRRLCA